MDSVDITKRYMTEYNKLVDKYNGEAVHKLLDDINEAISIADVEKITIHYNKLSEWNEYVANINGARLALNEQFKHIKLPSVTEFLIMFDNITKEWRFNTQAD